jgi:hypothetical protein
MHRIESIGYTRDPPPALPHGFLSVRLVDGFVGMGWDHPHLEYGNL